jgi:small subunit ribosomal protein S17
MEETQENPRGQRKVRVGQVVTAGADKTIVVAVRTRVQHARYGKIVKRTSKFMAHDEKNVCSVGDVVKIVETRPLSKRKRWRYVETIRKTS